MPTPQEILERLKAIPYPGFTRDIVAFGTVPVLLLVIALVACSLPAYRASRVRSLTALRTD